MFFCVCVIKDQFFRNLNFLPKQKPPILKKKTEVIITSPSTSLAKDLSQSEIFLFKFSSDFAEFLFDDNNFDVLIKYVSSLSP